MSVAVINHQAGTPQTTSTELLTLSFAHTNRVRIGSGATSTSLSSNSKGHHPPRHTLREVRLDDQVLSGFLRVWPRCLDPT
jgi:hypothetical protein